MKYRRLLDWEKQAILDAYLDGEKVIAICAEFDVSHRYPVFLVKSLGLKCRMQGRPKKATSQKVVLGVTSTFRPSPVTG